MAKTIEILLEKSRMFVEGMKRHISETGERGVTNADVEKLEKDMASLAQQSGEVDRMRAELSEKVRRMNETLLAVKDSYNETKKVVKGFYSQERWIDYGIPDKR